MFVNSYSYDGDCYFTLQYNGDVLDAATSLDTWLLDPPAEYPYFCYFITGSETGLTGGIRLTGATSGAVIKVGKVITTGGALGSDTGAGIIFFQKVSGEIVSGENLDIGATVYAVSASVALDVPVGCKPRSVFMMVETNSIRIALGGVAPVNAAGTPAAFGAVITANQSTAINGWKNCKSLQIINAASGSNAVVNMMVLY